jgi:hypothetical protein
MQEEQLGHILTAVRAALRVWQGAEEEKGANGHG